MTVSWPWLTFALLGAYHGLNPGMGWLFAVALGLQEKSRRGVLRALPPMALGHALSISAVVTLMWMAQLLVPEPVLRALSAGVVLSFGLIRLLRSRHPRWVGMRVGARDLTAWSFMMASAHGAGLMLVPVMLQCHALIAGFPGHVPQSALAASLVPSVPLLRGSGFLIAAVGIHTASLLLVAGVVAVLVYERLGLALLRSAWINLDLVWSLALLLAGIAAAVL
jgi:hypothetical protein